MSIEITDRRSQYRTSLPELLQRSCGRLQGDIGHLYRMRERLTEERFRVERALLEIRELSLHEVAETVGVELPPPILCTLAPVKKPAKRRR